MLAIIFQVWQSQYPVTIKYLHDMKTFSWKYTQFSQFNCTDTLLLVSGVHFGTPHSTSGEIAVFRVAREYKQKINFLYMFPDNDDNEVLHDIK